MDLSTIGISGEIPITVTDPDQYPDPLPSGPKMLPAGRYTVTLQDFDMDKDSDGKVRVYGDQSYAILLRKLKVVAPDNHANRTITFQRVFTKPYERPRGTGKMVSGLGDLIRSFDSSRAWSDLNDALALLNEFQADSTPATIKTEWEAFDKDYYEQILAQEGIASTDKPAVRGARRRATIRGMYRFLKNANGDPLPVVIGPSGKQLDAKLIIVDFIPSHKG